MNPNVLAWSRKFLAAAFGGAADGILIGFGGSGAFSMGSGTPVNPKQVLYILAVNVLLDTARFVKANPDPWAFPVADPSKPQTPTT
jgi:hypothetical protein